MARPRVWMRLALVPQPVDDTAPYRTIAAADAGALAALLWDAYHGTIDDEGESREDARAVMAGVFAGESGPLLTDCSFLAEDDGQVVAATLAIHYTRRAIPLLSFVMTHPDYQNRGFAAALIKRTINALLARGERDLALVVTEGNAPAQHLYAKLGFRV